MDAGRSGVDQKAITQALTFGYAEPANTYIHPNVLDFDKGVKTETHGKDIAAKLKELGVGEKK